MRVLYKPLIAAAVGAAGSMFYYPKSGSSSTIIGRLSLPVIFAITTGASSFVNDVLHDYVFPQIAIGDKLNEQVSAAVSVGSSAVAVLGVSYILQPALINDIGIMKLGSVGILAEVASSYIFNNFLD